MMKLSYHLSRTLSLRNNEFVKIEMGVEKDVDPKEEDPNAKFDMMKLFITTKMNAEEASWKV